MSAAELPVEDLQVGRVYGDAVWSAALKAGAGGDFADELDGIANDVVAKNPRFEAFLNVGTIKGAERQKVLDDAFKGRVSELAYRLLTTLNQHDRLGAVRAVAARVRQLAGERQGVRPVTVRSAEPLTDAQRDRLTNILANNLGAQPQLQAVVEPGLIGGLQVVVGEIVYDYSVRTNLERLHEGILTRSTHEVQSR
jgi:F-type H+-transporting ATPase subunit delta